MSLEAGMPVFDDDHRLEYQDTRENYGEDRFITIGYNGYTDILYVCYTMRQANKIRLISVRPATRKESMIYKRNIGYS